jgi:hypothetical protein
LAIETIEQAEKEGKDLQIKNMTAKDEWQKVDYKKYLNFQLSAICPF